MKILNCVIADDEPYALDIIENYISKIDSLHLIARCANGFEVYNILHKEKVDLLFLDINMPQLSGLDLFRSLNNPPKIIFTTAYKEHAVDAFELNAVDYLLKPFSFERFLKSIEKALQTNTISENIAEKKSGFIILNVDRQKVRIPLNDIKFIEGLGNYLKVHTTDKVYVTYQTIKTLLDKLPKEEFIQIHKSYIVPLSKVQSYTYANVKVGDTEIPIGRMFRKNLL